MTGIIIFFVISYVAGILSLLYGKKMVNVLLAVYAFCGVYRFVLTHYPSDQYVFWIAIGAGVLAIVLVKFAKNLAFFLLGAAIGLLIGLAALNFLPEHPAYVSYCVIIGCALLFGFLMSHYNNVLIRYGTAYVGGEMIMTATLLLLFGSTVLPTMISEDAAATIGSLTEYMYGTFAQQYTLWILIGSVVLMFFGAAFQKKH